MFRVRQLLIGLALVGCSLAEASGTRTTDADALISSDHQHTWIQQTGGNATLGGTLAIGGGNNLPKLTLQLTSPTDNGDFLDMLDSTSNNIAYFDKTGNLWTSGNAFFTDGATASNLNVSDTRGGGHATSFSITSQADNVTYSVNPIEFWIAGQGTPVTKADWTGEWSFGNKKIHLVADPTSAQDVATKNYVDTHSSGANTSLSNLTSPTAVNQDLTFNSGKGGVQTDKTNSHKYRTIVDQGNVIAQPLVTPNSGLTFSATMQNSPNADYSLGTALGILRAATYWFPNAAVGAPSNGVVRLIGTNSAITYLNNGNITGSAGAVRFRVTPHYSGAPSDFQIFLDLSKTGSYLGDSGNNNIIEIANTPSNNIYLGVVVNGNGISDGTPVVGWSPTAETTYEFEADWDSGHFYFFVQGTLVSTLLGSYSWVGSNFVYAVVGQNYHGTDNNNFDLNELDIFNAVQHTTGYSAPSAIPFTYQ